MHLAGKHIVFEDFEMMQQGATVWENLLDCTPPVLYLSKESGGMDAILHFLPVIMVSGATLIPYLLISLLPVNLDALVCVPVGWIPFDVFVLSLALSSYTMKMNGPALPRLVLLQSN